MAQAVALISNYTADNLQEQNQRRLVSILEANKIDFILVDGANPDQKEMRDTLFGVSSKRGKYPQLFIQDEAGQYNFIGLWEEIESLIECDALPAEVLEANPNIPTFAKTFANVKKTE